MEQFETMYKKINALNGNIVTYKEVSSSFDLGVKVDTGGGKYVKCVLKDDTHIVLEFFIPKGEGYGNVYHDCLEIHRIIIGELFETKLKGRYKEGQLFTARKGILHGFKALEDTIGYSYLYAPDETN